MPPSNTNTEIALLKQETQYIKEGVARLESKQDTQHKLLYDMLKDFIETSGETFATKKDHEANSKRIAELEENKWWVLKLVSGAGLMAILILTGLNKFFNV